MTASSPAAAPATTIAPFLMFQDARAEEAMNAYVALFPGSRVVAADRYGAGQPGPEGTLRLGVAEVAGQRLMFSDSFVKHAFDFTPSVSLFVTLASLEELERVHAALAEGGATLMPPGDYGFSRRCAWVNDRFGVSWQLNVP